MMVFIHLSPADWAQIVTAAAAILTVLYAGLQVRRNTQVSRGQFWLELEKMFSRHDEVHMKLRPQGEWAQNDKGPSAPEDWVKVEDYMGLMEHCELMLKKGLLDFDTFESIFGYRVGNILANKMIVEEKLIKRGKWWQEFIHLVARLEPGLEGQVKGIAGRVLENERALRKG